MIGKEHHVQQPHEMRYVLYIVYEGKRSSPQAWSDHYEFVQTQEKYFQEQGHQTEVTDRDA